MDDQTPKTNTSTRSIVRDHSPYCEATGPIVHEGFVAARVRAIQEKHDGTHQKMSHSPMTPCPVSWWFQITDPLTSPKSSPKSRLSTVSRMHINTKEPVTPLSYSIKTKASPLGNAVHGDKTGIAAGSPPLGRIDADVMTILSPQAIPSSRTKASEDWAPSYHKEGPPHDGIKSMPILSPRRSATDRLGSPVGHGRIGSDVFGKAYNDRQSSGPCTPARFSKTMTVHKSRSQRECSHEEALPLRRCMNAYEKTHACNDYQRSTDQTSIFFEDSDPECIQYSSQCKQGHGTRSGNHTKVHASISGSEGYENKGQDSEAQCCRINHRAWSSRRPNCSKDCQNHQIEPQKLSIGQEIDRHLSEWVDSGDFEHSKLQQSIPTDSLAIDNYKGLSDLLVRSEGANYPSPVCLTQSSSISSATTQQSKQSASRSTSWFTKLTGYTLILADKTPVIRDLDGEKPVSMPKGGETTPATGTQQRRSVTSSNLYTPRPNAAPSRHSSESQRLTHSGHCKEKRSATSPEICQASTASKITSTTAFVRYPLKGRSTHPMDEHVMEENGRESPQEHSPAVLLPSFGVQTPASPHGTDKQSESPPQSIYWQTTSKGRGIKKVQVIVSVDEADNLIVEIKLLRMPAKESSTIRAEQIQDLEGGQFSDFPDQAPL